MENSHQHHRPDSTKTTCVAAGRSGEYITGGRDGALRLRSITDAMPNAVTFSHDDGVEAVAATPELVASSDAAGRVRLWAADKLAVRASVSHHADVVTTVAISDDSASIVSGSYDTEVVLTNATSPATPRNRWSFDWKVTTCSFHPTRTLIAVGGLGQTAHIVGPAVDGGPHSLPNHDTAVVASAFSPDGTWLVTADFTGCLRLWRSDTWALARSFTVELPGGYPISLTADRIYVGTDAGVSIFDYDGTRQRHVPTDVGIEDLAVVGPDTCLGVLYDGTELMVIRPQ